MILGKVIGNIVSVVKHDSYANKKLMLVRPITPDGKLKSGTLIAVDTVNAGPGDVVLIASEGRAATEILQFERRMPVRDIILGIVDAVDWPLMNQQKTFAKKQPAPKSPQPLEK